MDKIKMEMSAIEAEAMGAKVHPTQLRFNERGWLFKEDGKVFWLERSSLMLATMDVDSYKTVQ